MSLTYENLSSDVLWECARKPHHHNNHQEPLKQKRKH